MMRGKRENFFSREKKPHVGFVILFPLSRHSLGDGGSLPFKKSGETFLFDKVLIYVKYVKDWGCGKTQNGLLASVDAV